MPDGKYTINASLYSDADGMNLVWRSTYAVEVKGGIANLMLGEVRNGGVPLPEVGLDGPLYLGISVGSSTGNLTGLGEEMRPLTRLSSSPNALSVADNSITKDKLNTSYVEKIVINGDTISGRGTTLDITAGTGIMMTRDGNDRVVISSIGGGPGSTPNTGVYWSEGGNSGTSAGTNYLGTSDNQPFEIHVYQSGGTGGGRLRVMRYEPNGTSANIIGGNYANSVDAPTTGGVIAGGGETSLPNSIQNSNFSVISGGRDNVVNEQDLSHTTKFDGQVIAGGSQNRVRGDHTTIGGGIANAVETQYSTIAGGSYNSVISGGSHSTVGGGEQNLISGYHSVISGGDQDTILGHHSYIGGGLGNLIEGDNNVLVGGGYPSASYTDRNQVAGAFSSLLGGKNNRVGTVSNAGNSSVDRDYSTLGGGQNNNVNSNHSFLGGGLSNYTVGNYSVIGGGSENTIDTSAYTTVAGGRENAILSSADYGSIGGGDSNKIQTTSAYSTIAGGLLNLIDPGAPYSTIGGGRSNKVQGRFSTISGGDSNQINHVEADHNFTGGGLHNVQNNPSFGTIGGGRYNLLDTNAWASIIGGGEANTIRSSRSVLGGGSWNTIEAFDLFAVLTGGEFNSVWAGHAFLGGGNKNLNHDHYGALVGGYQDTLRSSYGFLGGGKNNLLDWNSDSAVLVGGSQNYINFGENSFLGGGLSDTVLSSWSFLGGGWRNKIDFDSPWGVLGGGDSNVVSQKLGFVGGGCHNLVADGVWATIVAGCSNTITDSLSFIGGGSHNMISRDFSTIVGGGANMIDDEYSSIGGGYRNSVSARLSLIGGGGENTINDGSTAAGSVIGGGVRNQIFEGGVTGILSGSNNWIGVLRAPPYPYYGVIAGGDSNRILQKGEAAAITGGKNLIAQSYTQVVMGRNNKYLGTSTESSIRPNDPIVIVGNGETSDSRTNAFEISNNGHSVVHDNNGTGRTIAFVPGTPAIVGGTYVDNVILAWGEVDATGTAVSDFGMFSVSAAPGVGVYKIELNVTDAYALSAADQEMISQASITVTVLDDSEPVEGVTGSCGYATASKIRTLIVPGLTPAPHPYFYVRTYSGAQTVTGNQTGCNAQGKPFMFKVTGRK